MRLWSELKYLVRKLNRRRAERELEEEIRLHLEMETREKITDGLSREEAQYAARRAFGNVALATEDSRAWWGGRSLDTLWQDLRYGARILIKQPAFTAVAALTLALGIGANTAIFSVINALILNPPRIADAGRVAAIWRTEKGKRSEGFVSYLDLQDWRAANHSLEEIAGYKPNGFILLNDEQAERLQGMRVTANFLSLLKVNLLRGRD